MAQEEKSILLKDLCARLPYGVICQLSDNDADVSITEKLKLGGLEHFMFGTMGVLPYLRPMSSMTDGEFANFYDSSSEEDDPYDVNISQIDWLNSNHFDYHGLIEKGLAIEAPKDMYNVN